MNSVETLHSAAMEYFDLGKIAKAKGDKETHDDYLNKAYTIGMEAALRSQTELEEDNPLKAIYLRSISWLAYQVGKLQEAKQWGEIALSIAPNIYEKTSLEKLLTKIKSQIKPTQEKSTIIATLTAFDIDENQISVRENGKKVYKIILLDNSNLQKIIPFFMGKVVEIFINDKSVLEGIRLAA